MIRFYKIFTALFALAVVVIAIPSLLLAYPGFLFDRRKVYENFVILSNQATALDADSTLECIKVHLQKTEFDNPSTTTIVLCETGELMSWIERLSLTSGESGFHHFSGTIYLFPDRITKFQSENQKVTGEEKQLLKYTYQEFELRSILIHEVLHKLHSDTLGWWNFKRKMPPPHWKAEGFAEYYTFLFEKQHDTAYDFRERIRLYIKYRDRFPLMYLKSQLLYEFLTEYQKKTFLDIMSDEITEEESFESMMKWYDGNRTRKRMHGLLLFPPCSRQSSPVSRWVRKPSRRR